MRQWFRRHHTGNPNGKMTREWRDASFVGHRETIDNNTDSHDTIVTVIANFEKIRDVNKAITFQVFVQNVYKKKPS